MLTRARLKLSARLIEFCLDHKIDNEHFLKLVFYFYEKLLAGCYYHIYEESNHHYIPRFLLRKFSIPSTDNIYQYSHFKTIEPISIGKEAALSPNLYSFKDKFTKTKSNFLEKQLFGFTLERFASRVLNKIIKEDGVNLTNLEQNILTSFISMQYTRTPKFIYLVKNFLEYLHLDKKVPIEDMIGRDFHKKAFFDNYYKVTPREFALFSSKNKLSMHGADDLVLRIAISIGERISTIIYKNDLRMLEVKNPGFFFLSDNPAGIFNVYKNRSIGPFIWELSENSLIYIPISPNRCLYYLGENIEVKPGIIGSILQRGLRDSIFQFAYSDRKDDPLKETFTLHLPS